MKIEHLQFVVNRYDHYYDAVNNKGQFFLGLNTFIIGVLGATYSFLNDKVYSCSWVIYLFMGVSFISAFISIFHTLRAVLPFVENNTRSLIFFASVSQMQVKDFVEEAKNASEMKFEEDLTFQVHQLATGLTKKYKRLTYAGYFIAIEFIALIPFSILLINILNN